MLETLSNILEVCLPFLFIGGMFDWLLGKDEKEQMPPPQLMEEPWQTEARGAISEYARGETPYYQRAGTEIDRYLGAEGMPPLWGAAGQEIEKTLGGAYEPYIGKQYEPLRRQIEAERGEASTRLQRQAQMAGMSQSTPYLGIESKLEQATLDQKLAALGKIYEAERGRQMQAVPYGAEMGKYESQDPLRKAEAAMAYEERPLSYAQNLLTGYKPSYYQPSYSQDPSLMDNLMQILTAYAGSGGPFGGGTTWGGGGGVDMMGELGLTPSYKAGTPAKGKGFMEQLEPLQALSSLSKQLTGGFQSAYDWFGGL